MPMAIIWQRQEFVNDLLLLLEIAGAVQASLLNVACMTGSALDLRELSLPLPPDVPAS